MKDREPIGMDELDLDDLALEALAEAHATPPPPGLRNRVLAEVRRSGSRGGDATDAPSIALRRWRAVGAVAATLAVVLGGLLAISQSHLSAERTRTAEIQAQLTEQQTQLAQRTTQLGALAQEKQQLEARLNEASKTLVGLQETIESQGQLLQVLSGPRTIMANLAPKGDATATARVLVDPATGNAALVVADLGSLDAEQVYELWAIRGSRPPQPAGLFTVSADRSAAVRLPLVANSGEVTAFAVSIEPKGGSQSPTGPIVLVGAVTPS